MKQKESIYYRNTVNTSNIHFLLQFQIFQFFHSLKKKNEATSNCTQWIAKEKNSYFIGMDISFRETHSPTSFHECVNSSRTLRILSRKLKPRSSLQLSITTQCYVRLDVSLADGQIVSTLLSTIVAIFQSPAYLVHGIEATI